jgi:integrase
MSAYKHPRTGRWVAQTYSAESKKKIQLGTCATKREAEALIRAARDRTVTSTMTVDQWRRRWLDTPEWKPSTRMTNDERTAPFAVEHGSRRMADIDRTTARDWVRRYPSHHKALSAMFGAAVYDDVTAANPFSRLVKRRVQKRDLQPDWLTETDIVALERAAVQAHGPEYGPTMAAMIRFMAETGIRSGELFVVEHGDLDPARGRMFVRRAADSHSRMVGTPKNGQQREIVLSSRAAEAARRAMRWEGTDRIFSAPRGGQIWNQNMTWLWKPVKACAGRPAMQWYELRHYCATRLLELGLSDVDVAVQLGHTDNGALVRDTYGHPSLEAARVRLREAMEREAA